VSTSLPVRTGRPSYFRHKIEDQSFAGTGDIGEDDADAVIRNRALTVSLSLVPLGVNTPFTFGLRGKC